ncbi:MAG TPA: hypothetical protein VN911_18620 [Candidatus Acidoferrum sp.]|nr:hypothetical protein [Candidatus Acidoferrum sp.]
MGQGSLITIPDYDSAEGIRSIPDSGPDQRIWAKLNAEESGASGKRKYEEFSWDPAAV